MSPGPTNDTAATVSTVDTDPMTGCPVHPADGCREDESWTAVDYRSTDGVEDIHGVTRACRNTDDMEGHG